MPDDTLTEIVCILDRSGSMHMLTEDTIGGFNAFVEEQRKLPGDCRLTLVQFDHEYRVDYEACPINDVPPLVYEARGNTALLDAVGRTINDVGARLRDTPDDERPAKVIVMITTDGHENASTDYTQAKIAEMVVHQEEKYGWEFVFLGANIDSFGAGASMSITRSNVSNFDGTSKGVREAYSKMNRYATSSRVGGHQVDVSADLDESEVL